ncbi:MAG: cellulase family glycosylhydrolase [Anaerolineales bacterium]|nr:cellulase family glycosylhydrolase [Anaerolineales bacterium]
MYLDINMHYVPGQDIWTVSTDPESQAQTADLWRMLADRYKDETIIAAYDLMNEPFNLEPAVYQSYMQKVVDAIREVDTNHLIIVEVIPGNNPQFVTVKDDNVMYDFHHYQPGNLTHENTMGLFNTKPIPIRDFLEIRWDRLSILARCAQPHCRTVRPTGSYMKPHFWIQANSRTPGRLVLPAGSA